LLALAVGAQLLGVHVDAMGAAVELRGSELDQLKQRMIEAAIAHEHVQAHHRLLGRGRRLAEIQSSLHWQPPNRFC
jgi:hypothetical protein